MPTRTRIQHKGPDVRAAEIAVATTDGDLTLDDYATETVGDVINPFNQSGMLIEPDGVEQISVDQIMNVLADPVLDGRTISPRTSGTDVVIEASQGVAVTTGCSWEAARSVRLNSSPKWTRPTPVSSSQPTRMSARLLFTHLSGTQLKVGPCALTTLEKRWTRTGI